MLADPGGGGAVNAGAAFAGIGTAIGGIVAAANSGGFGISHDGGQALINAIDDLHTAVTAALRKSDQLRSEPALGTTPAANVYKPFLATVASDPVQGAIPVLKKLQTDLVNGHAAIQKAMQNFQDTEQQNTGIWT
jgi:hypothetical protein